jgi:hypothetical protein
MQNTSSLLCFSLYKKDSINWVGLLDKAPYKWNKPASHTNFYLANVQWKYSHDNTRPRHKPTCCQHALLSNALSIADTSDSFSTIHTSKALETIMVFISYLNKHLWPFIKLLRMRGEQTSQNTVKRASKPANSTRQDIESCWAPRPSPCGICGCTKNIGLHDHFIWLFNCFIVFYVLYLMFYT